MALFGAASTIARSPFFQTYTAINAGANTVTAKKAPMHHVVTMFPTITFLTPLLLHLELAIHCKLKVKDHVLIDCNLKYNVAINYFVINTIHYTIHCVTLIN